MFPKDAPRSMKNRSSKMFMKSDDMTDSIHSFKRGGGGWTPCSYYTMEFFRLEWVKRFTECEKQFFWTTKADFGLRKQISDCESRFQTAKADFRLRKQISDCQRQILECENRFRSAKALPKASRRFFLTCPSGRRIFFFPEIRAGNFFCKVFLPPPPHRNKMVAPFRRIEDSNTLELKPSAHLCIS